MQKLAQIEQTLPLIGNMLLPAFIFAAALLGFYYSGAFSSTTTHILHIGIYLLSVGCTLAQIYFNRSKLLFAFFIVLLAGLYFSFHVNPSESASFLFFAAAAAIFQNQSSLAADCLFAICRSRIAGAAKHGSGSAGDRVFADIKLGGARRIYAAVRHYSG